VKKELYEEQARLENRMARLGVDKFRDNFEKQTQKERATDTNPYQTVFVSALTPLIKAIEEYRQQAGTGKAGRRQTAVKLMEGLDNETLAFITTQTVLDRIIKRPDLTPLALKLANYIEAEIVFITLDQQKGEVHKEILGILNHNKDHKFSPQYVLGNLRAQIRKKYEGAWLEWTLAEKTALGLKLIELLCQSTGLFEVGMRKASNKRTIYTLESTERFGRWMEQLRSSFEVFLPEYLPCVIPPKDWDGLQSGGYHADTFAYPINFVKTRSKQHKKALAAADLSAIYKAVNTLQRTPWTVNSSVLDVAFYLMDIGTGLAGLPFRVMEYPTVPHDIENNEDVRKTYSKERARIRKQNNKTRMQRLQAWKTIKIAQEFRKYDKIYFPYQLDFRGRIYSIPSYLTPQGTDLAKGLLQFGEGEAITDQKARDWLAIHGANCFGLDKVSFEERIKWVKDNEGRILEVAQEPLDALWWSGADSPFCFLAFCLEWAGLREAEQRGEDFVSRLPIAMDGSCNGLQHYSAMLRDPVAGKAVNLMPSDTPQDIYGAVAERVNEKLHQAIKEPDENNPEYQNLAKIWLEFGIDRKITKRPVMVLPYGGTFQSCMDYVREAVEERGLPLFEDMGKERKAIGYLAKLVWHSIGEVVISAKLAMTWLRKVAAAAMNREEAVAWQTPLGFPVVQYYTKMHTIQIETMLFGKRFQPRLEVPREGKPAPTRQVNGVAPNFVHSLDACVLMMTVNEAVEQGLTCFAMIHDSYATTAAKSEQLAQILRQQFIKLYEENNPLTQFENDEEPPFVGGLDLSQIQTSKYFFA